MAFKIGGMKGEDLGVLAGGLAALAGGPISLLALPAFYKAFKDDQEQQGLDDQRKNAFSSLVGTVGQEPRAMPQRTQLESFDGFTPSVQDEQVSRIPVPAVGNSRGVPGNYSPADLPEAQKAFSDNRQNLMAKLSPQEFLKQIFPEPDKYDQALPGVDAEGKPAYAQYGDRGGFKGPNGFRPAPATPKDVGGLVRLTGPGGKVVTVNEKSPEAQRMIAGGWNKEGAAPNASDRPWTVMSPEQAKAAGLTDGRQYKTNGINFEPITAQATSKFAFDRQLGKNRSVTDAELNATPDNFAPPVQGPQVKLFNSSGQEVGTGDPNDPTVQARISSGEVRTAPPRQFSGEQSKAAGFANDALTSEANVDKLMNPAQEPGKSPPSKFDPTGHQGWAISNLTAGENLEKYQQAKRNWGLAVLRQESGGAITEKEADEYANAFFPTYGDGPEVVAQKRAQRAEKVKGIIAASGGAYDANFSKQKPSDPDHSQLPPGSKDLGDGRVQTPDGKILKWVP